MRAGAGMESWRQAEAPVAQEGRKKGCGRQAEAWCKITIADTTTERLALFNLFFIFAIIHLEPQHHCQALSAKTFTDEKENISNFSREIGTSKKNRSSALQRFLKRNHQDLVKLN